MTVAVGMATVWATHTTAADPDIVVDAAFIAVVGVVLAAAIKAARCANRVVRLDGMDVDVTLYFRYCHDIHVL